MATTEKKDPADYEVSYCKCCGYDYGEVMPSYCFHICPCCDCEIGCHDTLLTKLRRYRATWVEAGMPWREKDYDKTPVNETAQYEREMEAKLKERLRRKPRPAEIEEYMKQFYVTPPEGWNPIKQLLNLDPVFY